MALATSIQLRMCLLRRSALHTQNQTLGSATIAMTLNYECNTDHKGKPNVFGGSS